MAAVHNLLLTDEVDANQLIGCDINDFDEFEEDIGVSLDDALLLLALLEQAEDEDFDESLIPDDDELQELLLESSAQGEDDELLAVFSEVALERLAAIREDDVAQVAELWLSQGTLRYHAQSAADKIQTLVDFAQQALEQGSYLALQSVD